MAGREAVVTTESRVGETGTSKVGGGDVEDQWGCVEEFRGG